MKKEKTKQITSQPSLVSAQKEKMEDSVGDGKISYKRLVSTDGNRASECKRKS